MFWLKIKNKSFLKSLLGCRSMFPHKGSWLLLKCSISATSVSIQMQSSFTLKHATITKDTEREGCEGKLLLKAGLQPTTSQAKVRCLHTAVITNPPPPLLSTPFVLGLHTMLWRQWGRFTHRLVEVLPFDAHVAVQHIETHQQSSNHHAFLFQHERSALVKLTARQDRLIFKAQSTGKGLTTVNG